MSNSAHLNLYTSLIAPHASEKASLQPEGCYVFKVAVAAEKAQIKAAVENLFDVTVAQVRTVKLKGKSKRFGQRTGRRKDWKKAYVTLSEGSIDLFSSD